MLSTSVLNLRIWFASRWWDDY